MHYLLTGLKDGKEAGRMTVFAASAGKLAMADNALSMLADYGLDCDAAKVEVLVCPTCKSNRWAEIHPAKTDATGFTLYCRYCEEGCVSPLVL